MSFFWSAPHRAIRGSVLNLLYCNERPRHLPVRFANPIRLSVHMSQRLNKFVFLAVTIGLICLGIAAPVGIVAWSLKSATAGKAIGFRSRQLHYYGGGAVKGNELWRISTRLFPGIVYAKSEEYQFYRLNLETGEETATDLVSHGPLCTKVWIGDQLYINTGDELFRFDGTALTKLPQAPPMSPVIHAVPFEYEGRLTMVVEFEANRYCLFQLQNEEWIAGREIVMPTSDHVWKTDSETGLPILQSRDRFSELPRGSGQVALDVVSHAGQVHLLFKEYPSFTAYRKGFVFADQNGDTASALDPENGIKLGWEPVLPTHPEIFFESMVSDRAGLVFFTWTSMGDGPEAVSQPGNFLVANHFLRRDLEGQVQAMEGDFEMRGHLQLASEGTDGNAYVIVEDRWWGRLTIHRIKGNTIEPAHVERPGFALEYLNRWLRLLTGLVLAICVHYLAAVLIVDWIVARSPRRLLTDGQRTLHVASTTRRACAALIDLTLAIVVLGAFGFFNFKRHSHRVEEYCESLYEFEKLISGEFGLDSAPNWNHAFYNLSRLLVPGSTGAGEFTMMFIALAALLLLRCVCEGAVGITPGKWQLGIRTMRSDLRRCSMARSLLRTLLIWLDLPLLLTPLPAAVSIALSKQNQRLGDRIADTVVVMNE